MKKLLQSLFIMMFIAVSAWAQNRTITGTVTEKTTGRPIAGVTVRIKGTQGGTQTSANGQFSLNVPSASNELEFAFLGFATQTITISGTTVNVALADDVSSLSEVVVVGYGTTTKEAFTGSAKTISGEQLEKKRVANITQALAGEVSGVRVVNTSGQPGTVATVRVRGFGSLNGNRDPLYVLDGVPFTGGLNSINPADIESTTVLKDAAATSIYGSRGANGVVLITTKTGKNKQSFIDVDVNFGTNANLIPRYDVIKSPEQYVSLAWEALYNQGLGLATPTADPVAYANNRLFGPTAGGFVADRNIWNSTGANLIDPATRQVRDGVTRKFDPENWEDYAFQNSLRSEVNVRMGGSSDKTSYYTSLGYLNDKGYSIKSDYERLTGRLNLTHQVKPWLAGVMNVGFINSKQNNGGQTEDSGSIFWFVDNMPALYPVFLRDANGNKIPDPIFGGDQYDYGIGRGFGALTNSIADTKYNTRRNDRNELNGNVSLNATILPGLTFENTLGLTYWNNANTSLTNKFYGSAASQKGSISLTRQNVLSTNLLNLLRYRKTFGDHTFEALAAHEATAYKFNYLNASRFNLVQNDSEDLNNGVVSNPSTSYSETYKLDSYFGQVNYDYKRKYFLSGSLRRDGSSRFVKSKWGTFGSVGAGWLISSEDFMQNQNILSSLKLKGSFGLIGDQAGVGYYPGYDTFNIDNVNDQPGFSFNNKGNPDLTWETAKMSQVGVEFGIGNYISASVDYYIKNTNDLIFDKRVGPSIGYALIKVNDGKLRNQGLEFDVTGHILKGDDFHLDLGINGEILKNKLTAMPIDAATGQQKLIDIQGLYGYGVGHSIYDFYTRVYTGVNSDDGRATWEAYYVDLDGDGKAKTGAIETGVGEYITSLAPYKALNPNMADKIVKTTTKTYADAANQYTGHSSIPKIRGAINLTGGYKGFDLSVQVLYSLGGYSYDGAYAALMHNGAIGSNNWSTDILRRWQKPGDVTDVPKLSNNQTPGVNSSSTRFITKADYLSLNNVRLSYTFAESIYKKIGFGGLSLWVSGDNLYFTSKRQGFNPSTAEAGSSNTYRYLPVSTISAGLRAKF
jgi:TonB-linked SusC/RagA family outer membrane protein